MRNTTIARTHPIRAALLAVPILMAAPLTGFAAAFALDPVIPPVTGKPTAPIAIEAELQSQPQIGQPVDIVISVTVAEDMSAGSLSVAADDPLAIIEPLAEVDLDALAVGETREVSVTVLPLVDQIHYLDVTVTGMFDGHLQSRTVVVPIRLPGTELRKAESEVAGKSEERVRSFEAIETVR